MELFVNDPPFLTTLWWLPCMLGTSSGWTSLYPETTPVHGPWVSGDRSRSHCETWRQLPEKQSTSMISPVLLGSTTLGNVFCFLHPDRTSIQSTISHLSVHSGMLSGCFGQVLLGGGSSMINDDIDNIHTFVLSSYLKTRIPLTREMELFKVLLIPDENIKWQPQRNRFYRYMSDITESLLCLVPWHSKTKPMYTWLFKPKEKMFDKCLTSRNLSDISDMVN